MSELDKGSKQGRVATYGIFEGKEKGNHIMIALD